MAQAPYAAKTCPICGKPAAERFRPFCSPRCKDVDLNRWLSGVYVVPGRESDDDAGEGKDMLRDRESD
jgi:endogenous inhibitor of DNA gyrase (YacG/DUF329 family)